MGTGSCVALGIGIDYSSEWGGIIHLLWYCHSIYMLLAIVIFATVAITVGLLVLSFAFVGGVVVTLSAY